MEIPHGRLDLRHENFHHLSRSPRKYWMLADALWMHLATQDMHILLSIVLFSFSQSF